MSRVCAACIGEGELKAFVRAADGPRGCTFCGRKDSPTIEIDVLGDHVRERLEQYFGYADDQLPYDSGEGGYLGLHWDTYELLFDQVGVDLPRDGNGALRHALTGAVSDQTWCEYSWVRLEEDQALVFSWEAFCEVVKHQRRFFFHQLEGDKDDSQILAPQEILDEILGIAAELALVIDLPAGEKLYRARASRRMLRTASELGPPPRDRSLQSNRMNPPGIPMFYGGSSRRCAVAEVRASTAYVGTFVTTKALRILDLSSLPDVPSVFSGANRRTRLTIKFLHQFQEAISAPVARDELTHVDYIPTQIVSEYLRFSSVGGAPVMGIKYPSVALPGSRNTVLFVDQGGIEGIGEHVATVLKLARVAKVRI